jgi:hypothetical protein
MKKSLNNNIRTLEDVRTRQMELKKQMALQKSAMIYGVQDIFDDMKPAKIALDLVSTAMGSFSQKTNISQLVVRTFSGSIIKNPRTRQFLNVVLPISINILPKVNEYIHQNGGYGNVFTKAKLAVKEFTHKIFH